jgi:hypothetical protein
MYANGLSDCQRFHRSEQDILSTRNWLDPILATNDINRT